MYGFIWRKLTFYVIGSFGPATGASLPLFHVTFMPFHKSAFFLPEGFGVFFSHGYCEGILFL